MVDTEIRLIIFFAAKDGEALYSQQKHPTLCNLMDCIAYQAPPSMGFYRQEYWRGLPFLLQGIFLTQGSNLGLPHSRQML